MSVSPVGVPRQRAGSARRLVMAHPFDDLYGSDRMFLASVEALIRSGWEPLVALPGRGPLAEAVRALGVGVEVIDVPVLRRSSMTPTGLPVLGARMTTAAARLAAFLRAHGRLPVYVNTITAPAWLVAARMAGVVAVAHVHEAEGQLPRPLRRALASPLLLADAVVANSNTARDVLLADLPSLAPRTTVVYNGVRSGPTAPLRERIDGPLRVLFVGRLSPRKAPHVAVEAVGMLRRRGCDVRLDLVGDVFTGYEWYRDQIIRTIAEQGLGDVVTLHGFHSDVSPFLAAADVCVVPSEQEPFGNVAVEAMLAGRPVVASGVQGLAEIVRDGATGWLVPPGDAGALAAALHRVLADWPVARAVAAAGHDDARRRFSVERYDTDLHAVVSATTSSTRDRRTEEVLR